jgi:PiT family inorganic phosphate transporter
LIGGLVGAAVAKGGTLSVVIWSHVEDGHWLTGKGLLWKVIVPMVGSPLAGFVVGLLMMSLLYALLRNWKPRTVYAVFGRAQMASAAGMGIMHGLNDAQKTMGIVALALAAATAEGRLEGLPGWLSFLRVATPAPGQSFSIALWIKVMCASVMASGTAAGGWRIIRTLGQKMVRLQPVNGFAAETTSAAIIGLASFFGIPVSTTHNVSAAIMGVGAAKRLNALKWTVIERMVWAWLLTLPISGTIAYLLMRALMALGFAG